MFRCIGATLLIFALASCGGQKAQTEGTAEPEKAAAPTAKLAKSYSKVLCYGFTGTPEVSKDYPTAAADVQHSMLTALGTKNSFKEVGVAKGGKTDAQTLLVKANITQVRIVSGAARLWGGAMAGRSNVALDLQLIDGGTQKVVHAEKLSTANNPMAAAWTGGSTDHSLLSDMGKIVAEYIMAVNPAK
jgi:curli biogenesis system outer membrane secretion channel CsgG